MAGQCLPFGRKLHMRIRPARGIVVGNACEYQQHRIEHDGIEGERGVANAAQHHHQRHRATGRVQAAQGQHDNDGGRDRQARSKFRQDRKAHAMRKGNAYQCRHCVARHNCPGLGHGAGGGGKNKNGAGTQRCDQPGQGRCRRNTQQVTQPSGEHYAEECTADKPQALTRIDAGTTRKKSTPPVA